MSTFQGARVAPWNRNADVGEFFAPRVLSEYEESDRRLQQCFDFFDQWLWRSGGRVATDDMPLTVNEKFCKVPFDIVAD